MIECKIPLIGFIAHSGTGKTTLLCKLLPLLRLKGLRVGMVKHAHHQFEVDTPGKDSYELRKAGAEQMLISSRQRWALMSENLDEEPRLNDLLAKFDQDRLDLILVEGFKPEPYPKIEVFRPSMGKSLLYPKHPNVIAVACDTLPDEGIGDLQQLDLNNVEQIADYICHNFLDNQ
ncbi:molybdopterin-guanine dinucleotide biosynthesis protein B [Aestuariirhabdus sp. Z084]|uniref:molybdopterin-guanine dinucleotide biosynthesis protein B n=1 Tax=Aestuariirhabdus haliotis TaxID=2918751 RepID=UPI00201B369F|nr:molybdopterin-guanine dinucleotide biosynthesis protein B [Aestuariirhabdus haliotis]MCL6416263.1 molybdopterin-guanine dinucleotide biosynthesis protein B [Aestuariirhabdus haliotis]MCL6420277.1 molybdopterin-guanine dinucleotide biosynthesis protein B [Aestuariirhabdus haliotis]